MYRENICEILKCLKTCACQRTHGGEGQAVGGAVRVDLVPPRI